MNVLTPLTFAALLVGANLPYWFSAMTMKSVGLAAAEMVQEVERQFKADPSLLDPNSTSTPDYDACVEISTKASLREMIAPAALVMLTPLVAGTFFGVEAVFGILTGGLVSGVQLAISMSNSGGAWDNAKKYISGGFDPDPALRKKDGNGNSTPAHDAAVTGDTVGDPFKDTSGPALNILMKLMAILSLVFAQYFERASTAARASSSSRGLARIDSARVFPAVLKHVVTYLLVGWRVDGVGAGSQRVAPAARRAEASPRNSPRHTTRSARVADSSAAGAGGIFH